MINYKEILEWMYGINNPESLDNHRLYALSNINKYYNKHISDFLNLFSDGWLHILDNNNNENVVLKFVDMFPVEISEINFSTNKTDVNYITCNITFQYSYIEQIN
jgi:predicted DNA-binding helix-hairpin-helix protein